MIATLAGFRLAIGSRRCPRIWIPLPVVGLLLLPLAIALLPLGIASCLIWSVPPLRALSALWQLLSGLAGTHMEIDAPDVSILVTFR